MKNSAVKFIAAGTIAVGIVAGLAIYITRRQERKEQEEEDAQRESQLEEMKDLGVPKETLEQILDELKREEGGFTEKVHRLLTRSPKWSDELLSEDVYLDPKGDEVLPIHVSQSLYKGRTQFDIYIEMPDYTTQGYNYPKVRDFKDAISTLTKRLWDVGDRPFVMLEAWAIVQVGEEKQRIIRINPEFYSDLKDEKSDGTKKFFENFKNKSTHEEEKKKLEDYLKNIYKEDVVIGDVILMWRISFKITTSKEEGGIDLSGASKILKEAINLEVGRGVNSSTVKYGVILFHSSAITERTITREEMSTDLIGLDGQLFQIEYPYFS